jgi:hypothetical protein
MMIKVSTAANEKGKGWVSAQHLLKVVHSHFEI